jgi:hypothetical protein
MKKEYFLLFFLGLFFYKNCLADDGFFYVSILPGTPNKALKENKNVVSIDYKICDFKGSKPIKCVISQGSVGGRVGQSYGIVQTLLPNQRVSAFEAAFFIPNQTYPVFIQSFPILADGTTSCISEPNKNYLTFYVDALGMKIICKP